MKQETKEYIVKVLNQRIQWLRELPMYPRADGVIDTYAYSVAKDIEKCRDAIGEMAFAANAFIVLIIWDFDALALGCGGSYFLNSIGFPDKEQALIAAKAEVESRGAGCGAIIYENGSAVETINR